MQRKSVLILYYFKKSYRTAIITHTLSNTATSDTIHLLPYEKTTAVKNPKIPHSGRELIEVSVNQTETNYFL